MSQASHKEVLELLLQGKTITEIADMLDVSRTTIYNRRKEFLDYAEKEGLSMAVDKFEIEDTFQQLANLAQMLELKGLEIQDAKDGCDIIDLLSSFEVDDPKKFINEVMKKSHEEGITGEEITNYAAELRKLKNEENKTYSNLIAEIEEKKSEYEELEENLKTIKTHIIQDGANLETQLNEANITRKKLDVFINKKEILESYGIKLEDINKLENLITNLRQHDFNLEKVMDFYESMIILRESLVLKREEYNTIEEKNKEIKRENDRLESLLQKNMSLLSSIKSFEKIDITPEDVLEIIKTVTNMSQGLNLSEGEAVEQFIEDVKTQYTERNGYKFQVEEVKKLQEMYQVKNSLLKEELEVLEEVVSDRRKTIEALRRITTLDINETEIVEWNNLIENLGYDVASFRDMINEIGGLPNYVEIKNREIKELEKKEEHLQENIKELKVELNSLHEVLIILNENITKEVETIKNTIDEFEDFFTSPSTGFKVRSTEILNDITENLRNLLTEAKEEWSTDLSTLDENIEKILAETERILQNSYKGGRIVGRFHSIEPISKILREEEVPTMEGTISVITMLAYIQSWLRKNKSEEYVVFNQIIKKLTEDLGDIY